jgi:hypothetical protein
MSSYHPRHTCRAAIDIHGPLLGIAPKGFPFTARDLACVPSVSHLVRLSLRPHQRQGAIMEAYLGPDEPRWRPKSEEEIRSPSSRASSRSRTM